MWLTKYYLFAYNCLLYYILSVCVHNIGMLAFLLTMSEIIKKGGC